MPLLNIMLRQNLDVDAMMILVLASAVFLLAAVLMYAAIDAASTVIAMTDTGKNNKNKKRK